MRVESTFSWNLDHDFKHCPDARSNLISTSFIIRKMCNVVFSYKKDRQVCKVICRHRAVHKSENRAFTAIFSGGLWWIPFTFLEDLVFRNDLTIEGVEEFDALEAKHTGEIDQ